ncbi:DUF2207 domain-containing protein [Rhizobium halophytocola]|uniref:Membrane protein YgcG n=1 Tax=Rhizobium halophytocola TaxID=735519 RepID=A0ABS4DXI8_9HYPH|nr:DUF2207 domain-containing protein [Rhizobium halophytocola]MBP1850390.1 putative membrane protein YgcG [Rhizobium halophytocola]
MRRLIFGLALLVAAIWFQTLPAAAREVINSYHSDITVHPDASLTVVETIAVRAEGRDIRRGIFRDFPLYAKDQVGLRIKVDFDLVSVERDGQPEAYHTESVSGGIRIYAGDADTYLSPGNYTYKITYNTRRWILRYPTQDELYWNVTGNGWQFPILKASASVHLPGDARPTETAVFTGGYGEESKDALGSVSGSDADFQTTRPLDPQEGLTILVGIPKGVLAAPSETEAWRYFLRDYAGLLIGGIGLLLVFAYYMKSWIAVGRDPQPGVIVPRWDAPDGLSPALVNYVDNKGFSGGGWTAFSATAIDLAVKGYVELDDLREKLVIRRTDKPVRDKLSAGQKVLLDQVGGPGSEFDIDKAHGAAVQSAGNRFRSAIEKEHRGKYYKSNWGYVVGGVALSLAVLLALLIFGAIPAEAVPLMIAPAFFSFVFAMLGIKVGRGILRSKSLISRLMSVIGIVFFGFVFLTTFGGLGVSLVSELVSSNELIVAVAVGGILVLNILFFFLMGAPTPLGRKLMDGIEGLRTYLTLAEKDRMNTAGAPTMSPQHFETLLPYAVALGVEEPWSNAFNAWLATAAAGAAAATAYAPVWYHGNSIGGVAGNIGNISSSMASTISSTIPTPKSSSGSSGGFSGGGGGGGGGGGW